MNFFDQQERARRDTRVLIVTFGIAVLAITVTIDLVVLLMLNGAKETGRGQFEIMPFIPHLIVSTAAVLGTIGVTSLFRTMTLRAGGSKVAEELGGVRVDADDRDPLRRRLRNIVEEISLASGVPVPDIYVLEKEAAINAFAAGYEPSSAAIGVTRGALEKLNREELQGVIAHEFSHILNGDMRLNIRTVGLLFGITVVALIGRSIVRNFRHSHRYRTSNKEGAGVVAGIFLVALAVMVIGYIGMYVARLIKASISRKREYLADASAVQFTRNPSGIGGALKKIAVDGAGSQLNADTEEVSHMMFGSTGLRGLFATHPPLFERILRLDPRFKPEHLQDLTERLKRENERTQRKLAAEEERREKRQHRKRDYDFTNILDQIGKPDGMQMVYAAMLAAEFGPDLTDCAHSPQWAKEVVCYTLLDEDPEVRDEQLLTIAQRLGKESLEQVEHLLHNMPTLKPEQRLPLAEMAFPALKRRPPQELHEFREAIQQMVLIDGEIDVFEYALAQMLDLQLEDAILPPPVVVRGNRKLEKEASAAADVFVVMALLGRNVPDEIGAAVASGMQAAGLKSEIQSLNIEDWRGTLDRALPRLNQLAPKQKERLLKGLIAVILHDHEVTVEETEVLRTVCASIRIPLPIITAESHGRTA